LIKSPKLYFYDTGVACSLLGIRDESQVGSHYLKGALFENLILSEFIKRSVHRGDNRRPYFWQDNHAREIDCLLVDGERATPVEIKAGKTMSTSFFANLAFWRQLTGDTEDQGYVVYGGDQDMVTSLGALVSWRRLDLIPG
jgi:predicted AAA+ superfamily ATPase